MYQRSVVLTGLHVHQEDGHHQVEAGSAEADSVNRRVAHQHLAVASAVRLVAHHVEERHLEHTRARRRLTRPVNISREDVARLHSRSRKRRSL